jgi:hypothetical protein
MLPTGQRPADGAPSDRHSADVVDALLRGRLVPFLGAGVNLCNRPDDPPYTWSEPGECLPNGIELASYLATRFRYPSKSDCEAAECPLLAQCDRSDCPWRVKPVPATCPHEQADLDLAHISQYGATRLGPGRLYTELNDVFEREYNPTDVHRFLASLNFPAPKAKLASAKQLLIVSSNYDDLMERAFKERSADFDLVFYDPETVELGGSPRGRFLHQAPGSEPVPIERPNEYSYPFFEQHPVVLKIHGTLGRPVVITEDHYIDYLADEAFTKLPKRLFSRLSSSHLLFLGYSLRDWNFRVFLRRIKRNSTTDFTSWAVVKNTAAEESEFWRERARVEIRAKNLGDYVASLQDELGKRGIPPGAADG